MWWWSFYTTLYSMKQAAAAPRACTRSINNMASVLCSRHAPRTLPPWLGPPVTIDFYMWLTLKANEMSTGSYRAGLKSSTSFLAVQTHALFPCIVAVANKK
jgi:hypothetical protein